MDFNKIVSVTGKSGLFELKTQRSNGVIVKGLDDGKTAFLSSRTYMFMPLINITIYTEDGGIELEKVFKEIQNQEAKNPPIDANSKSDELRAWFRTIIPNYEEENVYDRDIKKVIRWYVNLKSHDLLNFEEAAKEEEKAEEKPAKKAKAKKEAPEEKAEKKPKKAKAKAKKAE